MSAQQEDLGSFFKENVKLVKDYFETRLEIYRLRFIRVVSKAAGYLIWLVISLFLFFLLIIFSAVVLGLWLSEVYESYITGFGITTLIILLLIILLTLLRRVLFVNPIVKTFIRMTDDDRTDN